MTRFLFCSFPQARVTPPRGGAAKTQTRRLLPLTTAAASTLDAETEAATTGNVGAVIPVTPDTPVIPDTRPVNPLITPEIRLVRRIPDILRLLPLPLLTPPETSFLPEIS